MRIETYLSDFNNYAASRINECCLNSTATADDQYLHQFTNELNRFTEMLNKKQIDILLQAAADNQVQLTDLRKDLFECQKFQLTMFLEKYKR